LKILIADDDTVTTMALAGMLELEGHNVTAVDNGLTASEMIVGDGFQVLIADWVMPGMDGLSLCRFIRSHETDSYVYVMLLTGRSLADDRVSGLKAGADDFLTKPFDRAEILARLGVAERILKMEKELRDANRTIERTRRYEIEIGSHIQRALLMAQPPNEPSAFTFAAMNIPSRQIDGDFFDFFNHEVEVVDVFIGDAMGKGVPAALVAAGAKSYLIRGFTKLLDIRNKRGLPSPVAIVQHAHDGLAREFIAIGSFVTLCYLRLDANAGVATYVDCGHTKTVRWDSATKTASMLRGGNFPIGFVDHEAYEEYKVPLAPGDLFCLYSDGVTEAASPSGELFGVDRLTSLVEAHHREEPAKMLFRIREAVREHTRESSLDDDFTCVVVRVGTVAKPWKKREAEFSNSLSELAAIRRFVEMAAEDCNLEGQATEELQIAAHEATTNAILHGQRNRPNERLKFVAERLDGGIRLTLVYRGLPFEPESAADIELDSSKEGGLGLFIIEKSLTEVRYSHSKDGENRVTMTKLS
jgi:serine phosphatase RsbU (regulator of sigma subunit)/anti-sigma regulatory factor (Ser/Thr protein kinase)